MREGRGRKKKARRRRGGEAGATRGHEPAAQRQVTGRQSRALSAKRRGPRYRRARTAASAQARRALTALAGAGCRAAALLAKQQSGARRSSRSLVVHSRHEG
jgi:hypothetical protein